MIPLLAVVLVPPLLGFAMTGRRSRHRLARILDTTPRPSVRGRRRGRDRRPGPTPMPSPLLLELLAALLESGAPPPTALRHIGRALARVDDPRAAPLATLAASIEQGVLHAPTTSGGNDAGRRSHVRRRHGSHDPKRGRTPSRKLDPKPDRKPDPALTVLREAVRMAAVAGLPPVALVRRAAAEERRRTAAVRQRAIRRLEVLLVLPVGFCLLPAFVLLGIVPVIVDLLTG